MEMEKSRNRKYRGTVDELTESEAQEHSAVKEANFVLDENSDVTVRVHVRFNTIQFTAKMH